ncbi:MAG TPA: methyltransferase domain-containing protein [Oligoflexia bacterium]|nr:methyltransferase domain-containing protein [Oligoflexia bacterium]HMP49556.1 methyltransferase domain-containing protein [Oligoflexia bacterium]
MDDLTLDEKSLDQALLGLKRINSFSLTGLFISREIKRNTPPDTPLSIIDVACGSGDLLNYLRRSLKTYHLTRLAGCDINQKTINLAKSKYALKTAPSINFVTHDILNSSSEFLLSPETKQKYNIATCSLFLHHLSVEEVKTLITKLNEIAETIIISDLRRDFCGYFLSIIGTRILSRSRVVHFDGPASVLQAFTIMELKNILDEICPENYQIKKHWPFRLLVTINMSDKC